MNILKTRKITKEDFQKLDELNLIFITNPGRMGDEDGITFVIKNGVELTIYRIDGLMYFKDNEESNITIEDVAKQFPKWYMTWKNSDKESYKDKYNYLYMGFGNGLSIDNCIYMEYEPYLSNLVEKYLEKNSNEEKESLKCSAIFNVWEKALVEMANDKKMIIN